MARAPFVLVTGTTEWDHGRSRILVDEAYTNALLAVGLVPLILPPVDPAIAVASLSGLAGLVFTSGEDIGAHCFGQQPHPASGTPHPLRDAYEIALAREAYKLRIPTLALCRGAQIVNVAFGGTIVQDIPAGHPRGRGRVHEVNIDGDSRLASVLGARTIVANSTHHQSIDQPGTGLEIVGRSPDGIVEVVEHRDRTWWMVAVQWHPETLTDTVEDWDRRLFTAFAEEIRSRQRE